MYLPPQQVLRAVPVGDGLYNFRVGGNTTVPLFRRRFGLKPGDKVLDVGSGIGKPARTLTKYPDSRGEYHGFDIKSVSTDFGVAAEALGEFLWKRLAYGTFFDEPRRDPFFGYLSCNPDLQWIAVPARDSGIRVRANTSTP